MKREQRERFSGGPVAFYEKEVLPKLTPEALFPEAVHNWKSKSGRDWKGGCPRHESESGESFTVSPGELSWWCGKCEVGGGPTQYVHWVETGRKDCKGEDFNAAVRKLADLVGAPCPTTWGSREESEKTRKREARRYALKVVADYTEEVLWSEAGGPARDYLKGRGYSDEDMRALRFGLYLSTKDAGRKLREAGADMDVVQESALLWRDLEGYVFVPWKDASGRLLNLYGRWPGPPPLREDGTKRPKTQSVPNPKEKKTVNGVEVREAWEMTKRSPLFLDLALEAGHREVVMVEGLLDAAMAQVRGDSRVVGTVAGLASDEQLKTLVDRRVSKVYVCGDPDEKGDEYTLRNAERLMDLGVQAFVVPRLPDKMDPDEFIAKNGVEAWKELVRNSHHALHHLAQDIVRRNRPTGTWTDAGMSAAIEEAAEVDAKADPASVMDLDAFFWKVFLEETGLSLAGVQERRKVAAERREKEAESKVLEALLREAGDAVRSGKLEAARETLSEGLDRALLETRLSKAEPVLSVAEELEAHEKSLEAYRGLEMVGLAQRTLPTLDRLTLGLRGLMLLAAAPNVGKTALGVQLGLDVVRHNSDACFLFVSLEMLRWEMLSRMKCNLAEMDWPTLVFGSQRGRGRGREAAFYPHELESLQKAEEDLALYGKRVRILDERNCPHLSLEKVLAHLRDLKEKTGSERAFLFVDYLQQWPVPENVGRGLRSDLEADKWRIGQMKTLRDASDGAAVLVVSEARKPSASGGWGGELEDVMGAARGTYTPDMVLLLQKLEEKELREKGLPTDAEASSGASYNRLRIAKGRDGVLRGTVDLTFWYRQLRFEEGLEKGGV